VADEIPVVEVTWGDAVAFCRWLSRQEGVDYRLPTEAEWLWAAAPGAGGRWAFDEAAGRLEDHAWFRGNAGGRPRAAGRLAPNARGLFDVHGNVEEWCWEGCGASAGDHPVRGGGWASEAGATALSWRSCRPASEAAADRGFRIVRTLADLGDGRPRTWGDEVAR
jgi:formylglycine-generating enzyme required for sulfatase activity